MVAHCRAAQPVLVASAHPPLPPPPPPAPQVSGSIKFNGQPTSELVVQRTVAYVDQLDYHIPNLTCLETCQFSHE